MSKDCKIVQDLLPSYIDGLTNEETNRFIEEHIQGCENCQNILNSMKEKLSSNTDKVEKKKISYLKKYNRELKVLQIMILIILIGFILNVGRKYFIIESLHQKFNETMQNLNNYYYRTESYVINDGIVSNDERIKNGVIWVRETYYKEGDFIKTITGVSSDFENTSSSRGLGFIKKGKKLQAFAIKLENEKIAFEPIGFFGNIEDMSDVPYAYYYEDNFFKNLYVAIFKRVEKVTVDGKQCYVVENKYGDNYYVDIATGVAIKSVNMEGNYYNDFVNSYFEVNTVKDSDIVIPE